MLQESQLYWYKVLFLFELLAAEGIFSFKLRRRNHFPVRVLASVGICLIFAVFYPLMDYTVMYNSGIFFAIFLMTLFGFRFCFDESWWNILFCALAAYSVQHIAFVTYNMVIMGLDLENILSQMGSVLNPYGNYDMQGGVNPLTVLAYADCYVLIYWYFGYFLNERMQRNEDLSLGRKPLIAFSGLLIAVDIVLHMVTVMNTAADRTSVMLEYSYNLLCCILVLFLQFGILSRRQLEQSNDQLQQMLAQREKQYEIRRESMDIINIKHHDLKHQLGLLRKVVDRQTLQGMEDAVNRYDTIVSTGNEYLDLLLTEKSMLCQAKKIMFTYIADGQKLNFMEPGDVYSLFGNATENAIEYVEKLEDEEKRFIHLSVKAVGGLVTVHVENYFEGQEWNMAEGLPGTTKENKSYHGFGLRSIRMTAEKYGGEMSVHAADHLFSLDVVLPLR
ncbi:MAG TPA: GHKL domain-containing protein [Candidatus Mediterraneibacter stercoripullorum]|nr:GHKL domain-containing protein [Candidatus Mediterraneibacter stercoripullorum]